MKYFKARLAGITLLGLLACTSASAQTEPIVFVHGYSGSASNWDTMLGRFRSSGYASGSLYTFNYNSLVSSNRTSASELRSFVNTVRSRHGNARIALVAHSNGGLVSRWYRAELGGETATRRFVTLGTPHRGTTWAYACYSPACFEMRPGSSLLTTLGSRACDRSLWSNTDGIILPASSAQCGVSTRTADVSHLDLLTDSRVYTQLRTQLQ
ncbi:esterase/lipase family protein [Caldimonas brevitalea]|uniref:Lipase n=1 Tax=Caldimonas brevitalea TaxID=413882 RepID=A0A0G3BL99_9BURK|nr:hypothetical protein [Caldimonas brevitalea]AKJ30239.1 lipase [Caldimonas brevitalea]